MLDEYHPTWVAKRSNNVGSSKVGVLNPTLFDSLARALSPGQTIEQSWIEGSNFARSNIVRPFGRPCWKMFVQHFFFDEMLDRVCF